MDDPRNDSYFKELNKDLDDGDKLLFIGFARRDEADRQFVFEREKAQALAQTDKKIEVVNATYNNLIEQLKECKAVQITGGESPELVYDLRKYPEFVGLLDGKVVGGSSAGACLFSRYYFYNTEQGILEGLGTLPIRLMVHYGNPDFESTDDNLDNLKQYPDDLELITIPECDWTVRET